MKVRYSNSKNYKNVVEEGTWYLWYQYSVQCSVHNFDVKKYEKKIKIQNPIYIYNKRGELQGISFGETKEQAIRGAKQFLRKKILLTLRIGSDYKGFNKAQKDEYKKEEWQHLRNTGKPYRVLAKIILLYLCDMAELYYTKITEYLRKHDKTA